MRSLAKEGLVVRESTSFEELLDGDGRIGAVIVRVRVSCREAILTRIQQQLDVRRNRHNRLEVRGRFYQYHAWLHQRPGHPRRDLLRYDNAHGAELHRHTFDRASHQRLIESVARADMPTIAEFIREAIALAR
jgi:hypothetical protein